MTPQEQEAAFKRLREKYPARPAKWASGFIHGQQAASTQEFADAGYAQRFNCVGSGTQDACKCTPSDEADCWYAVGYIEGFAHIRHEEEYIIVKEALDNVA